MEIVRKVDAVRRDEVLDICMTIKYIIFLDSIGSILINEISDILNLSTWTNLRWIASEI